MGNMGLKWVPHKLWRSVNTDWHQEHFLGWMIVYPQTAELRHSGLTRLKVSHGPRDIAREKHGIQSIQRYPKEGCSPVVWLSLPLNYRLLLHGSASFRWYNNVDSQGEISVWPKILTLLILITMTDISVAICGHAEMYRQFLSSLEKNTARVSPKP